VKWIYLLNSAESGAMSGSCLKIMKFFKGITISGGERSALHDSGARVCL
jgi:hypothetical protein